MFAINTILHILYKIDVLVVIIMSDFLLWHEEENAVYEVDYECMRKKGKIKWDNMHAEENLVLNYFVLLLCFFYR